MLDSKNVDQLFEEAVKEIATSNPVARRIINQTALPDRLKAVESGLDDVGGVTDDGIPPDPPSGTGVQPMPRALAVTWAMPATNQHVVTTKIVLTATGETTKTLLNRVDDLYLYIGGLVLKSYTVTISFIDRWGHESSDVVIGAFTPGQNVADQIGSAIQVAAGNIVPYLPDDPNTSSTITNPAVFAEKMFTWTQMAGTADDQNRLPAGMSLFDNYKNATTQTSVVARALPNGWHGYNTMGEGVSGWLIEELNKERQLRIDFATFSPGTWFFPWTPQTPLPTGNKFIWSGDWHVPATSTSAVTVRMRMNVYPPTGTVGQVTHESSDVVINPGETKRIFVRWAKTTAEQDGTLTRWEPNFYFTGPTTGATVYCNRFALTRYPDGEDLNAITTAPKFTLPVLAAEVVSARMIAGLDINATNAIFANAAIDSAKINTLTANKIVAGTMNATISIGTSGTISTDGAIMSKTGLQLPTQAAEVTAKPHQNTYDWIKPASARHGMGFFKEEAQWREGILLVAQGTDPNTEGSGGTLAGTAGVMHFRATDRTTDGSNAVSTARIEMYSGGGAKGWVGARGRFYFGDGADSEFYGHGTFGSQTMSANSYGANIGHSLGSWRILVHFFVVSGGWEGQDNNVWWEIVGNNQMRFYNGRGYSQTVRYWITKYQTVIN